MDRLASSPSTQVHLVISTRIGGGKEIPAKRNVAVEKLHRCLQLPLPVGRILPVSLRLFLAARMGYRRGLRSQPGLHEEPL